MELHPALSPRTIERRTFARVAKLSRFATLAEAKATPHQLRKPHTRAAWLALDDASRLAHMTERVREQVIADEEAKLTAAKQAPAPAEDAPTPAAEAPAPTPAAPARAARGRVVACVSGCGKFHPAKSYKPVLVACKAEAKPATAEQAQRREPTIREVLRSLSRSGDDAEATSNGKKAKKSKKNRRRAVCSRSK